MTARCAPTRRDPHGRRGAVSTPEYAGALPGSFKNLLDWTIGDDDVRSMYQKPVAWIVASLRGADLAYESLRTVLGFAHANIVEAACSNIPVTTAMIDDDDLVAHLLVEGDHTVSTAGQVGYGSPFTFSTAFKRTYGISPRAYRDRAR